MYKAIYMSPMIPSFDLQITGNFFKDILNFEKVFDSGNYTIYEKNNLTVHILPAGENIGQMEFYLEVDNVDTFWDTIKDKILGLRVREPFNQDYGMREVHIEIPKTKTLLFIGQSVS